MRKLCTLLVFFAVVVFFFASCSKENKEDNNDNASSLTRKWASTNCGTQPYGSYYLYGDDPCPSGYRLPTKSDFSELVEFPCRWSESNNPGGVNGMWFGPTREAVNSATAANPNGCVFFPAAGYRSTDNEGYGEEEGKGESGSYISSTHAGTYENFERAWELYFYYEKQVGVYAGEYYYRSGGTIWFEYSVRCVKE